MRAYVELARAEFRRYSTYRMAIVAGVLTQTVFGYIRMGIFFGALAAAGGVLAGYDVREAASYVWIGQAILASVGLMGWMEIADRVKSGEIAIDLARPIDLQLSWLARDLGRATYQLLTRGWPPLAIGALTIGIGLPPSWTALPLGLFSLVLAVSISFGLRYLVNLIAFWTTDVRGFLGLYMVLASFLAGLFVPVDVLPYWLRMLAYATPFPSVLQFPIDVLSGRSSGLAAMPTIGSQLAWLAAVFAAGRLVTARAARKLVVQGG